MAGQLKKELCGFPKKDNRRKRKKLKVWYELGSFCKLTLAWDWSVAGGKEENKFGGVLLFQCKGFTKYTLQWVQKRWNSA